MSFLIQRFTDKQIELVTNFASQAVIATENVRLFDEVQARTHQYGAGAEGTDQCSAGAEGTAHQHVTRTAVRIRTASRLSGPRLPLNREACRETAIQLPETRRSNAPHTTLS